MGALISTCTHPALGLPFATGANALGGDDGAGGGAALAVVDCAPCCVLLAVCMGVALAPGAASWARHVRIASVPAVAFSADARTALAYVYMVFAALFFTGRYSASRHAAARATSSYKATTTLVGTETVLASTAAHSVGRSPSGATVLLALGAALGVILGTAGVGAFEEGAASSHLEDGASSDTTVQIAAAGVVLFTCLDARRAGHAHSAPAPADSRKTHDASERRGQRTVLQQIH